MHLIFGYWCYVMSHAIKIRATKKRDSRRACNHIVATREKKTTSMSMKFAAIIPGKFL